jgi:8-oxo-dGTP pyrophosphatase MutT (NUDIX family)
LSRSASVGSNRVADATMAGVSETPTEPVPTVPAATVVLLRDADEGLEVLMLRRNSGRGAFQGFSVFPGGRVDDEDEDEAAAAVREALEETGIVVDRDALVRFSHWTPPLTEPRRFATWFFLAPAGDGEVTVDDGEIVAFQWLHPNEVLAQHARGEVNLAPPTYITLHTLAHHPTVAAALEHHANREPDVFVTTMRKHDDQMIVVWDPDVAVDPDVHVHSAGPRHRIVVNTQPWVYERS